MKNILRRSKDLPIRQGLDWNERWRGPDGGLVYCWERGREMAVEDPALRVRADRGELMVLVWKGGVERKIEAKTKSGSLFYLAMWQGLKGDDLEIDIDVSQTIVCSSTGQAVIFSASIDGEAEL